jgi:hypothetical protein
MKILTTVIVLLAMSMTLVAQQTVEPPELVARRGEHLRAMKRVEIAPLTAYIQSLGFLKQQFAREGKPEAAAAVDAEIKSATDELNEAIAATNITTAAPAQFQIEQALFGDFQTNRTIDVTAYFQNAFKGGAPSVSIRGSDMAGATDPSPGVVKSVKIIYTFNGKRKEKTFKTGNTAVLDFKRDLK